jgi:hypothetical protein
VALSKSKVVQLQKNVEKIPVGKILCVVKAVLNFYECWKSSGSDKCIKTLIADVEKCLKGL